MNLDASDPLTRKDRRPVAFRGVFFLSCGGGPSNLKIVSYCTGFFQEGTVCLIFFSRRYCMSDCGVYAAKLDRVSTGSVYHKNKDYRDLYD